jgi:hypothetical protein
LQFCRFLARRFDLLSMNAAVEWTCPLRVIPSFTCPAIMKTTLLLLSFCCVFFMGLSASAQTKASPETVEELLKAAKFDQTMNAMVGQMDTIMNQAVNQSIAGKDLSPDAMAKVKAATARMTATIKEDLSPEKMREMVVSIYSDVYTDEELRSIIDFYKTPAGQALITKQPLVMQKTMAWMQQKMGQMMPKIQAAVEESAKESEKK